MKLTSNCSLCGHEYNRLFSGSEVEEHMASAHHMHLIRRGIHVRPQWVVEEPEEAEPDSA